MWQIPAPINIKTFMWLLLRQRLPLKGRLCSSSWSVIRRMLALSVVVFFGTKLLAFGTYKFFALLVFQVCSSSRSMQTFVPSKFNHAIWLFSLSHGPSKIWGIELSSAKNPLMNSAPLSFSRIISLGGLGMLGEEKFQLFRIFSFSVASHATPHISPLSTKHCLETA